MIIYCFKYNLVISDNLIQTTFKHFKQNKTLNFAWIYKKIYLIDLYFFTSGMCLLFFPNVPYCSTSRRVLFGFVQNDNHVL